LPTPPQTALVTGASVGIGLELSRLLARDGHKIVLVSRDEAKLKAVAGELQSLGSPQTWVIARDLSKPTACQEIAGELSAQKIPVDILINNAGFGVQGYFWEADLQRQLDLLQVNITALTHLTHVLLPGMIERGAATRGGPPQRIMNLASVAGFLPGPLMACYYASKAYVVSFSLALSEECRGKGVTVTAVCPGATRTEFQIRAKIADSELFSGRLMSGQAVAQIAYRAMLRGKPLVVTGGLNTIAAQMLRFVPRMLAARVAGSRNRLRGKK
jgi:uncharacterized protein